MKNFAASWDLMASSTDMLLLCLAEEAMVELNLTRKTLTKEAFTLVVDWIFARVSFLPDLTARDEEGQPEDDDEQRALLLGSFLHLMVKTLIHDLFFRPGFLWRHAAYPESSHTVGGRRGSIRLVEGVSGGIPHLSFGKPHLFWINYLDLICFIFP